MKDSKILNFLKTVIEIFCDEVETGADIANLDCRNVGMDLESDGSDYDNQNDKEDSDSVSRDSDLDIDSEEFNSRPLVTSSSTKIRK